MKDVDGDGRIDLFCRLIEMPFSQVVRFDSSRKQVWMSERLSPGSGDESGMPIVDLDGDGRHAGQFIRDAAFAGRANVAPYGVCRMARRGGLVSNGGKQISITT